MKLFDNITELSSPISFHISNESDISPQLNDAFIPMMIKEVKKLQQHAQDNISKYKKISDFENDKLVKLYFQNMANLIEDRFGLPVQFIAGAGGWFEKLDTPNAATIPLPLVRKDLDIAYKWDTKDFEKYADDKNKLYSLIGEASKALEEQIKKSAIIVDYSKAKIKGIPKDSKTLILITCGILINSFAMVTPEEITAVILHEIGHTFFHYLYCYYTCSKTLSLTQGMLDYVNDKNKDPKEALILSYIDVTNDKSILEYKNKNPIFINVEIERRMQLYIKHISHFGSTENEAHSDRFTAAFGMGDHLASFLFKFHLRLANGVKTIKYNDYEIRYLPNTFYVIEILKGLVFGFSGCVYIFIILCNLFAFYRLNKKGKTYDNPMDRIMRIKTDTISLLKTLNLPKNEMKTILEKVDMIDGLLQQYKRKSIFQAINRMLGVIYLSPHILYDLKTSPYLGIERQLEQLMNNDLYTASARIETII